MRPPPIGIVIGVFLTIALGVQSARRPRVVSLPMPTSETIPYVAEVMGATSYEEVVEEEDKYVNGNKRVQRKLNVQAEGERELDPEHPEYQEYQGNKTRVMGRPGVDFPVLPNIPRTEFSCRKVKKSGYYADLETGCQVFHICDVGRKISFLCPNGTIFRQSHLICDWWFRVDCERSVELYDESAEQLAHDQMIYKKRADEIARAMKSTTTSFPTTERQSNYRNSRRRPERPSGKLIDSSQVNQAAVPGNQIVETFVDNRAAYTKTNQAANVFPPSGEGKLINPQPPPFGYDGNPSGQPSSISYSEQRSTHIAQEQKPAPGGTNYPNNAAVSYSTQDFNAAPTGPQNTYQQPPVNTIPTAGQVYQQANADFNNLGLSTANPPINNYQHETGNTNYKFSYTASAVGQSSSSSIGAPKDFTNNQVFSQQTAYHQEKESQIPAETASFGSNRHRFANQLEEGYQNDYPNPNKNLYTATPTTTSTEIPSTSTISSSTYNADPSNYQNGATIYNQDGSTNYNGVGSSSFTNRGTTTFNNADASTYSSGQSSFNGDGTSAFNTVSSPSYTDGSTTYNAGSTTYNGAGSSTYKEAASTAYQAGTNDYRYHQTNQNTVSSTRAPPTTKPVNRGSFKHPNSKHHQIDQQQLHYQQTSVPYTTSTLVPSSSQVYNSHMQPYSSLNQEEQFANDKQNSAWKADPSAPAYSTGKESYSGESSSQTFSTYNSYTTGQNSPTFNSLSLVKETPSSTAKPHRGKTVFNVKIRPNKDYSLLELHRLYPTNSPKKPGSTSTTIPPFVTSERPSSYATYASQPASSHTPASTVYTSNVPQTSGIWSTFPSAQHKYATVNITGTPEEIRPENVNSLMDTGINPTSADALHTFASIYSSAETDGFYDSTARPHVSDVVLTLGPSTTEEPTTTIKPITSTNGEELPSELSKNTKDSYSYLFSDSKEQIESQKDDLTPKESGSAISDLNRTAQRQANKSPSKTTLKTSETTTIKPQESTPKFRDSSELRELAQVFSRALSAYLEDPETFKEILAQVRPTEPNPSDTTTPNPDDEVLDFSDASQSRTGTTEPPGTTIFNTDDVTADISIGAINNLASSAKLVELDNSYETNSISPFASQSAADVEFTTPTPTTSPEINIVSSGSSLDYDSKLGSPEDTSYFPTAGGVGDDSRPRYGGFHNNTRRKFNSYSPYGAELRNNVTTGTPITESTTVSIPSSTPPPYTSTQFTTFETTTLPPPSSILPAAQQVNNLVASHNVLYGTSAQFTSSSEEQFDSALNSEEQEKLLQTSGSQSLVSSHNYASFAQNFNKQGQKLYGKDTFANYAPSAIAEDPSAIGNEYFKGDYLPYFGQEPPLETISQPSAFQTQTPNFGDKILKNRTEQNDINTQASVNSYTIDSRNIITNKGSYEGKNVMEDRIGTVGALSAESTAPPTWTVSPYETTQYFSSSSVEVSPSGPGFFASSSIKPTTYHPHHSSEATTVASAQPESTTASPTTTVQDTTTTEAAWPITMSPESPEYHSVMQAKAKEMFGMLNETAATMLMEVMTQAENNMTLRKLVLLLVDDRTKDKTEEKTRINLINALLTHENDIEDVSTVATTTPVPKKKIMKIMRVRAGSGRSLKIQRGLDTQTAVAGSNSIRNVTEFNKANAAKLYIPSGPAATQKPTTVRSPTTTLSPKLPYDSDARALELLKTLYNLAAKWG